MSSLTRPPASDPSVARRMSRQRRAGTEPEMIVRRALHRDGYRYRVNFPLPGLPRRRADLVFTRSQVAVFIDGCFWHSCPEHATHPKANQFWWQDKLAGNVLRDRATDAHLRNLGWQVLRFWEHQDPAVAVAEIQAAIDSRTSPRQRERRGGQ